MKRKLLQPPHFALNNCIQITIIDMDYFTFISSANNDMTIIEIYFINFFLNKWTMQSIACTLLSIRFDQNDRFVLRMGLVKWFFFSSKINSIRIKRKETILQCPLIFSLRFVFHKNFHLPRNNLCWTIFFSFTTHINNSKNKKFSFKSFL